MTARSNAKIFGAEPDNDSCNRFHLSTLPGSPYAMEPTSLVVTLSCAMNPGKYSRHDYSHADCGASENQIEFGRH